MLPGLLYVWSKLALPSSSCTYVWVHVYVHFFLSVGTYTYIRIHIFAVYSSLSNSGAG